ncbi:MAG: SidJ-related pseudokinase, partial [Candidatus Desantisbacteria bacterium]
GYLVDLGWRFDIPKVLAFECSHLIKLSSLPIRVPNEISLHPKNYAIAFMVSKDYFSYPNSERQEERLSAEEFKEVMSRCAYLLGYLARLGIIHTDVIPLFHNRVQTHRRTDNGIYQWWQRGRLDRWFFSCDYPNFGISGIRDFEHFISWGRDQAPLGYQDNLGLYHMLGTQLLGLLLVAGSYFRNKDRERLGFDSEGNPIDARDLFEQGLFGELIRGIYLHYYQGVTQEEYKADLPFDLDGLTQRMIDEMGVDTHMQEILRQQDQGNMTDDEFRDFLEERGYSEEEISEFNKGRQDISVLTGPHLGGFNQEISLSEMIEAIERMAALMVGARFRREKSRQAAGQTQPNDASSKGLPRPLVNIVVKISEVLTGKKIRDWRDYWVLRNEDLEKIQKARARLRVEEGINIDEQLTGIQFIRAPPSGLMKILWRIIGVANYYRNGVKYIILPENASVKAILHEINA